MDLNVPPWLHNKYNIVQAKMFAIAKEEEFISQLMSMLLNIQQSLERGRKIKSTIYPKIVRCCMMDYEQLIMIKVLIKVCVNIC